MPRPRRLSVAGGLFYILQRGNNRQSIVHSVEDRRAFIDRLRLVARRSRTRVHAYCLMDSHVHLVVEPLGGTLSGFAQQLFASYTRWFNRRHQRAGHLFQGRFQSMMVEPSRYLLPLTRYMHAVPVKAGLAAEAAHYPWSSMADYVRLEGAPGVTWTGSTLALCGGLPEAYRAYVDAGRHEPFNPVLVDRRFLGSAEFAAAWGADGAVVAASADADHALGRRLIEQVSADWQVASRGLRRKYVKRAGLPQAKAVAAFCLREATALTLPQIGALLGGISASAVGQHVQAVERNPQLLERAVRVLSPDGVARQAGLAARVA